MGYGKIMNMTKGRHIRPALRREFILDPELLASTNNLPFPLDQSTLGQHLLASRDAIDFIIDQSQIGREDIVADVGAGAGALTRCLANVAKRVVAIEKDARFAPLLSQLTDAHPNVDVHIEDFLDCRVSGINAIVANPPFGLLEAMFKRIVDFPEIRRVVLVLGEASARRLTAHPGESGFGRLALLAHAYY